MILDPDLFFVIGLVAGILSLPAFLSAFSESRPPRTGLILIVIAAVLITTAVVQTPEGTYSMGKIPEVLSAVADDILH